MRNAIASHFFEAEVIFLLHLSSVRYHYCEILFMLLLSNIIPFLSTTHQLIKRFGLRTVELGGGRKDRARSVLYFRHRYYRAEELA